MPDIVPIVRRPVKKLSSPSEFEKRSEPANNTISSLGRKFNLSTDKSSGSKIKRICDGNHPAKSKTLIGKEDELPVAVSLPKYHESSDFVLARGNTRNVLPELKVAEQRVAKTSVSLFTFPPPHCLGPFNDCYSYLKVRTRLACFCKHLAAACSPALPGLMVSCTWSGW